MGTLCEINSSPRRPGLPHANPEASKRPSLCGLIVKFRGLMVKPLPFRAGWEAAGGRVEGTGRVRVAPVARWQRLPRRVAGLILDSHILSKQDDCLI